MTARKTAGLIFREAREKAGLTQHYVAKKAGIHPNTLAKIERDEQSPTFPTIKKICKVLGIDISEIPD